LKLAAYLLAAVLFAGLVVGVASSTAPVENASREAHRSREVFVNSARLARMHPSHEALVQMKAALARCGGIGTDLSNQGPEAARQTPCDPPEAMRRTNRDDYAVRLQSAASDALGRLEESQDAALRARIEATRDAMIGAAENELAERDREIELAAAEEIRILAQRSAVDRLNAGMKLAAVESAARISGLGGTITRQRIEAARTGFGQANELHAAATGEIRAEADELIGRLRDDALAKIDAVLSIYEAGEKRRIHQNPAGAGLQLLFAPDRLAGRVEPSRVEMPVGARPALIVCDDSAACREATALRRKIARLERRIASDVERSVRRIAAEEGMRVVSRPGTAPDETRLFTGFMRDREWNGCGAVLSGLGGS